MKRFYPESDGGPGRKAFYVVDRYADPLGDQRRTDCETMAAARKLARTWNAAPPLPAWDTIQANRDSYQGETLTTKEAAEPIAPRWT